MMTHHDNQADPQQPHCGEEGAPPPVGVEGVGGAAIAAEERPVETVAPAGTEAPSAAEDNTDESLSGTGEASASPAVDAPSDLSEQGDGEVGAATAGPTDVEAAASEEPTEAEASAASAEEPGVEAAASDESTEAEASAASAEEPGDEAVGAVGVSGAESEPAAEEQAEHAEPPVPTNPNFKWYVVHTYSGYENRAKKSLEERIRQLSLVDQFGEILIPTENVVELGKGGQKKTTKRKFFPGYMLVQMELNDESWHLVKSTPKITGFVGSATQPPSVPEAEVRRLTQQIDEGTLKPKPRVQFEEGENVRVIDGPFSNFNGVVDAVNQDKARVRVLVSIFGRSTPVELEFIQVEKA